MKRRKPEVKRIYWVWAAAALIETAAALGLAFNGELTGARWNLVGALVSIFIASEKLAKK